MSTPIRKNSRTPFRRRAFYFLVATTSGRGSDRTGNFHCLVLRCASTEPQRWAVEICTPLVRPGRRRFISFSELNSIPAPALNGPSGNGGPRGIRCQRPSWRVSSTVNDRPDRGNLPPVLPADAKACDIEGTLSLPLAALPQGKGCKDVFRASRPKLAVLHFGYFGDQRMSRERLGRLRSLCR